MFNLNEDNRIVMAQHPTDMRKGVNTLCGEVRRVGLDPTNGDVYIFVGKSRKVMKLLHRGRQSSQMAHARLGEDQAGHGREPNCGIAAIQLQNRAPIELGFAFEEVERLYSDGYPVLTTLIERER